MTSTVSIIARNEFYRTLFNPMVIVVGIILLSITCFNAAGGITNLRDIATNWNCDGFIFGFSQIWSYTNYICGIMAAYLGVMSISAERGSGSLGILLVKPLYRRDVILGKFIGVVLFLFAFLVTIMLANSLFLLNFYGSPASVFEFLWRISIYTLLLLLDLSLVTGIAMLIGLLFKDLLLAVSVVVTYLSYEWFWNQATAVISNLIHFPAAPYMLTMKIFGDLTGDNLFNTNTQFSVWINNAYPYLFVMVFLAVIMLLMDCFVYSRDEDV